MIDAAFQRGAAAFILKRIDPVDLAPVIRQALDGNVFYPVEARPAATEVAELGPDAARGGHPQGARRGALEQADRPPVLAVRADDQVPPDEHLPQARRRQPHRGRPPRLRARDDREPDAARDRRLSAERRPRTLRARIASGRSVTSTPPFLACQARRKKRSSCHSSSASIAPGGRRGTRDRRSRGSRSRWPQGARRVRAAAPAFWISSMTPTVSASSSLASPAATHETSRRVCPIGWTSSSATSSGGTLTARAGEGDFHPGMATWPFG